MPDLYVSALGSPFRAVLAHAGGDRAFVRLGDRADDDFGLDPAVWVDHIGAASGAQAALLDRAGHNGHFHRIRLGDGREADDDVAPWSDRDFFAILVRRLLAAAETQSGESVQRVVCIVPGGLTPTELSDCAQAAILAGAQLVELTFPSGSDAIVEVWDDGTRLTLSGSGESEPRHIDLSGLLTRTAMRELFRTGIGLADRTRDAHAAVADRLFDAWAAGKDVSRGMTLTQPVARGEPLAAYAPPSAFAALDAALSRRFEDAFMANAVDIAALGSIDVIGSWTRPVARVLRALAAERAAVRDDRGLELDRAIRSSPPQARTVKPALTADVFAVAESARPLRALAQGEPIRLLSSGARLPATSISENFNSSSFIGAFRIGAGSNGTTTLMTLPIPRYAERQASSYLRAVVHADTPQLMLLEVAYLYSTRRRFAFFDKRSQTEVPVPDHVFRVVRG